MACYDTVENERTKYTKETLESLLDTVDFKKHRLSVINNNSCKESQKIIWDICSKTHSAYVYDSNINLGTAGAINIGLKKRNTNEVCIKMDNDIVVHQRGWVDELVDAIEEWPLIGILGLKRDDVYGEFTEVNKYSLCDDIMGSCTALNPKLLDKVGFYKSFSVYGFDDVLMSSRSIAAGFRNAFLPHIKISHIDTGNTEYTEWKKREAGVYLQEASIVCDLYKSGAISPFYDGGFDD